MTVKYPVQVPADFGDTPTELPWAVRVKWSRIKPTDSGSLPRTVGRVVMLDVLHHGVVGRSNSRVIIMATKKSANIKQTPKRTTQKKKKKKPTLHCITGKIHFKNPKSKLRPSPGVRRPFRFVDSHIEVDPEGNRIPKPFDLYEFASINGPSISHFLPQGQVGQIVETLIRPTSQRISKNPKADAHLKGLAELAIRLCDELKQRLSANDAAGAASTALRLGSTFQWMAVWGSVPAAMTGHPVRRGVSKGGRAKANQYAAFYPQFQSAIDDVAAKHPSISHDKASRVVESYKWFLNPHTGKPVSYQTIKRHTSLPNNS